MVSPASLAVPRTVGSGAFSCCEQNHTRFDPVTGRQVKIACDKHKIAPIILELLLNRRKYHLGGAAKRSDPGHAVRQLMHYRLWTAVVPNFMQQLPCKKMPALPATTKEFLSEYRFVDGQDDSTSTLSGVTPLMLCAMSGNTGVVVEIITGDRSPNVNAQTLDGSPVFGFSSGATALRLAVAFCPEDRMERMVSALLRAGAGKFSIRDSLDTQRLMFPPPLRRTPTDPNISTRNGGTPLMAACHNHNLKGVESLIRFSNNSLLLESVLVSTNASALSVASFSSTESIVEALCGAGADTTTATTMGGTKLTGACRTN